MNFLLLASAAYAEPKKDKATKEIVKENNNILVVDAKDSEGDDAMSTASMAYKLFKS